MGQLRVKQKLGKCRLSLFLSFYTSTSQFMSFESIKHVFRTFFVLFHLFPASSFMILYTVGHNMKCYENGSSHKSATVSICPCSMHSTKT